MGFRVRLLQRVKRNSTKCRMQMKRGLSKRAWEVFPTPAFTLPGIPFKAPVLEQRWQNWYSFECGRGEKRVEIENECELHDSLPPSSLLLFSALSPTASPMSPSLSLSVSFTLSLSLPLQGI